MPALPKIPLAEHDRWMDSTEIAILFSVDTETVNRWRRLQKLRGYKIGRRHFYKKSDVNKLIQSKGLDPLP